MIVTSAKDHMRALKEHKGCLVEDSEKKLKYVAEDTREEIAYHWDWPDIRHLAPEETRIKLDAMYEKAGPPLGSTSEPINTFYED